MNVDIDKSVFLIGTKTKLAPTKALTVPRLELNAAMLLARWLGRIQNSLRSSMLSACELGQTRRLYCHG